MTREEKVFLSDLTENHIHRLDEVMKCFNNRFPQSDETRETVTEALRCIYRDRFGTIYYSENKLTAFQAFDSGKTIEDVMRKLNMTRKTVKNYRFDWESLENAKGKTKSKPKMEERKQFPSGAVFGKETSSETIWRQ